MTPESPLIITIEHHGRKYIAELPWDAVMDDVVHALRGLLVSDGWAIETVDNYIPIPE